MMAKVTKTAGLVLLIVVLLSGQGSAQEQSNKNYLFHLYYDGGLSVDRDYPSSFEIVDEEYEYFEAGLVPSLRHVAEVISPQGKVIDTFFYDPVVDRLDKSVPAGNFIAGKIVVPIPALPNIQKVNFYDENRNLLLSVDVVNSVCNQNNVCDDDAGENWFTCLADCPPPSASIQPTETVSESGTGAVIGAILYIVGGLALAFVAWVIYRSKRQNQAGGV